RRETDVAAGAATLPAVLVNEAAGDQEFAVFARFGELGQRCPRGLATTLRAVLDDAVVLAGRLERDRAFMDVVAGRLLDVDVLAGLAGPDRHEGVPVVGRRDGDGVKVLVVERLPD